MAVRIEVGFKTGIKDALGENLKKRIIEDLGVEVTSVRTINVYTIDQELSPGQIEEIRREIFTDPITEQSSLKPLAADFDWIVEVGYWPGVTDNVGRTSQEAIEDLLKIKFEEENTVYTSRHYLINGGLK